MEKCINCKHLVAVDICYFCRINGQNVNFPRLMGGSKKCECYEKIIKNKSKFNYPIKKDKSE